MSEKTLSCSVEFRIWDSDGEVIARFVENRTGFESYKEIREMINDVQARFCYQKSPRSLDEICSIEGAYELNEATPNGE